MDVQRLALIALGSGVTGWALENLLVDGPPRYSQVFDGKKVPFMPVYAAGGAAVALLAPHVARFSWPLRGLVYGASLTALEAVSGVAERVQGKLSWDYSGQVVDLPHALAWAGLGLAAEQVFRRV